MSFLKTDADVRREAWLRKKTGRQISCGLCKHLVPGASRWCTKFEGFEPPAKKDPPSCPHIEIGISHAHLERLGQ